MNKFFVIFVAFLILTAAGAAFAQDCPFGMVDDPAPGSCSRYIDENGDGICDHSQQIAQLSGVNDAPADGAVSVGGAEKKNTQAVSRPAVEYYMWQIAAVLAAGYILSLRLVKLGKLTLARQRRFWNAVLLLLFFAIALTSIVLLLKFNYKISVSLPFNVSFWHIESGWAMTVVLVFHALWHIPYFKSYFAKPK